MFEIIHSNVRSTFEVYNVSYVRVYRYNPKYLYPKLNAYGDYSIILLILQAHD